MRCPRSVSICILVVGLVLTSGIRAQEPLQTRQKALASALQHWHVDVERFLSESERLLRQIRWVYDAPGWDDMVEIIEAYPTVEARLGQDEAVRQTRGALDAWSRKWRAQGLEFLRTYLSLTVNSGTLEERRLTLIETWERLVKEQAALTAAARTAEPPPQSTSPPPDPIRREADHRRRLNQYGLNDLELYEKRLP